MKNCIVCHEEAKWVRVTQFSGKFYFCKKCAKLEEDFKKSDPSYYFWMKVKHETKT